jgi:hypothetical protein
VFFCFLLEFYILVKNALYLHLPPHIVYRSEEIIENPPKKQQWKNAMKKAINSFWYDKWTNEKKIKSTFRLYFWSVFLILQMNSLSSSFEFSISHMSMSFSIDESSLAKVVNKIIAFSINSFWYDKWTNEKKIKSTLEYLEIQQNPIGTPHNILRSVKNRKF